MNGVCGLRRLGHAYCDAAVLCSSGAHIYEHSISRPRIKAVPISSSLSLSQGGGYSLSINTAFKSFGFVIRRLSEYYTAKDVLVDARGLWEIMQSPIPNFRPSLAMLRTIFDDERLLFQGKNL